MLIEDVKKRIRILAIVCLSLLGLTFLTGFTIIAIAGWKYLHGG